MGMGFGNHLIARYIEHGTTGKAQHHGEEGGRGCQEIKTICDCGAKATVNARIDSTGHIVTQGAQVVLGGNDSYIAMCHKCWVDKIRAQKEAEEK